MRGSLFLMAAAAVAFVGAVTNSAARTPVPVNDTAIMEGMPKKLSDFGFFHLPRQQKSLNAVRYELNTPLYSDGADKLRFAYVPHGKEAVANGEGLLEFPVGSALIKTFAFGEGSERRLIETRVLLHREEGWVALPYLWDEEQTDARLALAGARVPLTTPAGEDISYRVPNKNQCKQCHVLDGEVIPIGPKARNLSREWLRDFAYSGKLDKVPNEADSLPPWEPREGSSTLFELDSFARAYLDVNCAHCHQPGAMASNSGLDLRWEQGDGHAIGIRKPPVAAGRGAGGHLVSIDPGSPETSIMVHRMSSNEPGVAMPELGKATVDEDGLAIIREWIAEMETQ
ncbi:MAG: SO2930 family diheme c-type cytochrome [Pseudomonadota bacterium]